MRRSMRTGTALVFACAAAACSSSVDHVTLPHVTAAQDNQAAPAPGTCTTYNALASLVTSVFGPAIARVGPALNALDVMQHQIAAGNLKVAQDTAYYLVNLILTGSKSGTLRGSAADILLLVNSTLCYAGLPSPTTDPDNAWVVYPTDAPQVIMSSTGMAGTALPGHVVTEPTLITFTSVTDAGPSPLDTKLDQYPNYVEVTATSASNAPLTQPVVIGVCPSPDVPDDVRARLRLGHQATTGFEVTPEADASFLACPTSTALDHLPRWLRTLASIVLPRPLYARTRAAGGVGGTAGSFSPFAPVDPQVSLSGGVGGTAGTFVRSATQLSVGCAPTDTASQAPIGSPVDPTCRPGLSVHTRLGTVLQKVPLTFAIDQGGGSIAPATGGTCGMFASTVIAPTGPTGTVDVCWTMGPEPGTNTVVATPGVGGDATAGVTFSPASIVFTATANPPTGLVFTEQPAAGSTVTAGSAIPVQVAVVDQNGVTVQGFSGPVFLGLNLNTFSTGASVDTVAALSGIATYTGVAINTAAPAIQFIARATLGGTTTLHAGNFFDVVAGAAYTLAIVHGDGQSVSSGSVAPTAPVVKVTDVFGNPVNGAAIAWRVGPPITGSVNPSQSLTRTDGTATAAWTVDDGPNQLTADLSRPGLPKVTVVFHATGTATVNTQSTCPVAGLGVVTPPRSGPFALLRPAAASAAASPSYALQGPPGSPVAAAPGTVSMHVLPVNPCTVFR